MFTDGQPLTDWKWDDLRAVLAVARAGSLSGAARLLGTSHPTVFRRIRDIEARVDRQLFERSAMGYAPTPAGELVIAAAERMASDIDALGIQLGRDIIALRDTLRITSPDTVYHYVLAPLVAEFRRRFPEVTIEMLVTDEFVNLQRRDADIAIRATRRSSEHLYGVRLQDITMAVHAHRDHPATREDPPRLRHHDWIGFDETLTRTTMAAFLRDFRLEQKVVFRANSFMGVCEAVRRNIGLGVIPCYVGHAVEEIVRLPLPDAEFRAELWVVSTPALQRKPVIRAFFDFIQEAMVPLAGVLSGETSQPGDGGR